MPAKFNVARSGVIVQCLGRNRPSTTSTSGNFVLQKVLLIKKSKSSINFVRHFLSKQWNVAKIIDIRVA